MGSVVKFLSSWLAKQEVRGSIPGLATTISEIRYLLQWRKDRLSDVIPQNNQPTNQYRCYVLLFTKLCMDKPNWTIINSIHALSHVLIDSSVKSRQKLRQQSL